VDSKEMKILAFNSVADQSRKQGKKEEALLLFTQAMNLISEYGASPIVEAAVCSNYGILLTSLEQHDKAVQLQKRALELDKITGIPESIGYSSHNLGMALVASGDPSTGVKYLQEAREIRQSINDYDELVATLEMLSTGYLDMDQIEEAKKYAEQGYGLKSKVSHPSILRGVITILAQVVLKEGDIDRASRLQADVIVLLEQLRQENSSLARLDLFDSRYNKRYLDAIELFLEAKCYHAAFALIERTRFRSGCDILEGIRTFGSPLDKDSIIIPEIEKDELIITEWIYPKYSWVFLLNSESHGIQPKKIITSTREVTFFLPGTGTFLISP
jgi:tetratricopeptide (TPR) repeat protein